MQLVFPNVYHPLDNVIQLLNNWGYRSVLESCSTCRTWLLCRIKFKPLIQTLYFAIHSASWISYFLLRAQSCCPILGLSTEGVVIVSQQSLSVCYTLLISHKKSKTAFTSSNPLYWSWSINVVFMSCKVSFYIVDQLGRCMFFECKLAAAIYSLCVLNQIKLWTMNNWIHLFIKRFQKEIRSTTAFRKLLVDFLRY